MATKRDKWLMHFLDSGNTETFLNRAESAKAAGYKCKDENFKKVGWANYKHFEPRIVKWLDEAGLSEGALKLKLLQLLDAKETKFFSHMGKVKSRVDVQSLGIQVKALEMALKVKGMFAPEKRDHRVEEVKAPTLTIVTSNNDE